MDVHAIIISIIITIMMQHQLRSEETSEDEGGGRNYGSAMIPLGKDFEPGDDDVLVGR